MMSKCPCNYHHVLSHECTSISIPQSQINIRSIKQHPSKVIMRYDPSTRHVLKRGSTSQVGSGSIRNGTVVKRMRVTYGRSRAAVGAKTSNVHLKATEASPWDRVRSRLSV